jgi:hypothetical protein
MPAPVIRTIPTARVQPWPFLFGMAVFPAAFGTIRRSRSFTTRYHEEKATLFAETLPYIAASMSGTRDPGPVFS